MFYTQKNLKDTTDLECLMENETFCEALSDVFTESFQTDDEKEFRRGKYMLKAKIDNNIDDLLIAICGYSFNTLVSFAEQKIIKNTKI